MLSLARVLVVALVATSALALAQHGLDDVDGGGYVGEDYEEEDEEEAAFYFEQSAHWQRFASGVQRSTTGDGLLRARRWANIANGALLTATGPVALGVNLVGLKLSKIVLSLYVTLLSGVLTGVELGVSPIAPWVTENLSYLTTASGRTALLAFLGGLTWPLGKLGLVPALLTCANAVFNANFNALHAFVSEDDPARAPDSASSPTDGGADGGQAGEPAHEAAGSAYAGDAFGAGGAGIRVRGGRMGGMGGISAAAAAAARASELDEELQQAQEAHEPEVRWE